MNDRLRPLVAGNWKMNGIEASLSEIERLKILLADAGALSADVLVCPPATLLSRAADVCMGSPIELGGQDCHAKVSGAHTGDISAQMVADAGGSFVIVGHSERRADHGEGDAVVKAKAEAALAAGLTPIVCVGETAEQRAGGQANQVVGGQVRNSLPTYKAGQKVVVAYEPVWAIGTGNTATAADIADMHAAIRAILNEMLGAGGEKALVLYGGSVKPSNAREILATPNVNGALVGGASLLADDFFSIIIAA